MSWLIAHEGEREAVKRAVLAEKPGGADAEDITTFSWAQQFLVALIDKLPKTTNGVKLRATGHLQTVTAIHVEGCALVL